MKLVPFALAPFALGGVALISASAFAQTAPSTVNGIPNTPLSQSPEPSTGPRSTEANLPSNNAAAASGGGMAAAPTVAVQSPAAAPMAPPTPTPDQAFPAPAPMASYPMCSAGVFDHCMEPGNGGARSVRHHRTARRHR